MTLPAAGPSVAPSPTAQGGVSTAAPGEPALPKHLIPKQSWTNYFRSIFNKPVEGPKLFKDRAVSYDLGTKDGGGRKYKAMEVAAQQVSNVWGSWFLNLLFGSSQSHKPPLETALTEVGTKHDIDKFKEDKTEKNIKDFCHELIENAINDAVELYNSDHTPPSDNQEKLNIFLRTNCVITASSWARTEMSKDQKCQIMDYLTELKNRYYPNITIEILSAEREKELSTKSTEQIFTHTLVDGKQVTKAQLTPPAEAGGGSTQTSFGNLEIGGNWATNLLKGQEGPKMVRSRDLNHPIKENWTLTSIKDEYRNRLLASDKQRIVGGGEEQNYTGKELTPLVGIFTTAFVKNPEFVDFLKTKNFSDEDLIAFKKGKKSIPLQEIKAVLNEYLKKLEAGPAQDQINKGSPIVLTLGYLEALEKKGGGHLKIIMGGEDVDVTYGNLRGKLKNSPCVASALEAIQRAARSR